MTTDRNGHVHASDGRYTTKQQGEPGAAAQLTAEPPDEPTSDFAAHPAGRAADDTWPDTTGAADPKAAFRDAVLDKLIESGAAERFPGTFAAASPGDGGGSADIVYTTPEGRAFNLQVLGSGLSARSQDTAAYAETFFLRIGPDNWLPSGRTAPSGACSVRPDRYVEKLSDALAATTEEDTAIWAFSTAAAAHRDQLAAEAEITGSQVSFEIDEYEGSLTCRDDQHRALVEIRAHGRPPEHIDDPDAADGPGTGAGRTWVTVKLRAVDDDEIGSDTFVVSSAPLRGEAVFDDGDGHQMRGWQARALFSEVDRRFGAQERSRQQRSAFQELLLTTSSAAAADRAFPRRAGMPS